MSLVILAYPELDDGVLQRIQQFRKQYDQQQFSIVDPHFTLVFPSNVKLTDKLLLEINSVVDDFGAFKFSLFKAEVIQDVITNQYMVFLTTEKGNDSFQQLHTQLYVHSLQPYLRSDIPYVPHITIGRTESESGSIGIAEKWNQHACETSGIVRSIVLADFTGDRLMKIKELRLLNVSSAAEENDL